MELNFEKMFVNEVEKINFRFKFSYAYIHTYKSGSLLSTTGFFDRCNTIWGSPSSVRSCRTKSLYLS